MDIIDTALGMLGSIFGGSSKPESQQRMESYQAEVKPLAYDTARRTGLTVYAGWYGSIVGVDPAGNVTIAGNYGNAAEVDPMLAALAARSGRNVIAIESLDPFETHVVYPNTSGAVIVPGGMPAQSSGDSTSWLLIGTAAAVGAWLIFRRR